MWLWYRKFGGNFATYCQLYYSLRRLLLSQLTSWYYLARTRVGTGGGGVATGNCGVISKQCPLILSSPVFQLLCYPSPCPFPFPSSSSSFSGHRFLHRPDGASIKGVNDKGSSDIMHTFFLCFFSSDPPLAPFSFSFSRFLCFFFFFYENAYVR